MANMIADITPENFQTSVIEMSEKIPVLLDFWAPWCRPCKQVMPMLEALTQEYAGRFFLAKVNTEEQQELSSHFSIQSIPSFKVVVDGKIVEEMQGAQPISEFKKLLEKYMPADETEELRSQANVLKQEGKFDEALEVLAQASQQNPHNFGIHFDLIEVFLLQEKLSEAKSLFEQLPDEVQTSPAGKSSQQQITLAYELQGAPSLDEIEQQLISKPKDPDLLQAKSKLHLAHQQYEEAFQNLMILFQVDRNFSDGYARKTLLEQFENLKSSHPALVNEYRRKFQALLF
ncbi:tetratricopeptide repeat protein [Thiomicrorhabdus indica]|uniref:tetratricopeptide repeat protein n=1 Tax=Thiomicrorhabdus indica TaxID=2267253 RepID=UPI002AA8DB06|nr:tetratricopeptide repeat protein [Thiomicrorhabdus indica]